MPTDSTNSRWFYYIRLVGARFYLGLVDDLGAAPTAAGLDIDIYYQNFPDEITSDNDIIALPTEFMHALSKAVASEIIKMNGGVNALTQQYDFEWERTIYDAVHLAVDSAKQPMTQYPINLRNL